MPSRRNCDGACMSGPRARGLAKAGRQRLLCLSRRPDQLGGVASIPAPHRAHLAAYAAAAQSETSHDVGPNAEAGRRLAPGPADPSSLARPTLRRQQLKVGAACGNSARADLCGGRSAMTVPTAIQSEQNKSALTPIADLSRTFLKVANGPLSASPLREVCL